MGGMRFSSITNWVGLLAKKIRNEAFSVFGVELGIFFFGMGPDRHDDGL